MKGKWLIGIDEVGRGALAGPVTVAAVAAPVNSKFEILNSNLKLKDSKKLTEKQREEWFRWVHQCQRLYYATASVYPKVIDRINISQAANLAATRAFKKLLTKNLQLTIDRKKIFLDGGLFLKKSLVVSRQLLVSTIVRGDEKFNCIKLASIVAKVKRDRLMKHYHKKFPEYGFDEHKGYGTKAHLAALKKHGPCKLHRRSFLC